MSKFKDLNSLEEVNDFINQNELAFLYFTTPNCSVCHGLQPQIEEMMIHYPEISTRHIDASLVPEAAGQYSVFTAPVLLLFVEGKTGAVKTEYCPAASGTKLASICRVLI